MRRRLAALGVVRATIVCVLVGFGLGALLGLLFRSNSWWYPAIAFAGSGVSLPVRFLIGRYIARTSYDGNDRSRVIPVRKPGV